MCASTARRIGPTSLRTSVQFRVALKAYTDRVCIYHRAIAMSLAALLDEQKFRFVD